MARSTLTLRYVMLGIVTFALSVDTARSEDAWGTIIGGRTDRADGSSAITVGRKLRTTLETRVGTDFNLAAPQSRSLIQPEDTSSGAAWAKVTLPRSTLLGWDKATLDARVDSAHDTGRLGTSFSRSIAADKNLSVTVQDDYAVVRTLGPTDQTEAPAQSWETAKSVRLKVVPVDTTFSVGTRISTTDNQWLHSISAEQKILGPLTVSGGISETASGELNRSLSAGFKRTW